MPTLLRLFDEQALGVVLAAAAICTVSGCLLVYLARRAEGASPTFRQGWQVGTAVVAGTGVWTTHFVAMLGYRTDVALVYGIPKTLASAAAAILAVGVPLAASASLRSPVSRAAAGAVAGVGVGVMHIVGMAAIEGCVQTQSLTANIAACLLGGALMALARGLPARLNPPAMATMLFVLAVCGTHFGSLAGTMLVGDPASRDLLGTHLSLSLVTLGGVTFLLMTALAAIMTARRFEAQEKVHAAALSTALENMSNGLLKLSAAERVQIFNRRLFAMLRIGPQDVAVGMTLAEFVGNVGRANGWDEPRVGRILDDHRAWLREPTETRVEHVFEDGRILAITCQPVEGGAVLTFDDVSKAREAQREIAHLAFHDPLTGLANRRSLQDRIALGFAQQRRFTLLLLDLDRFKFVNDTFGHGIGDRVLRHVAERLRSLAEDGMLVSRLGGDEMALLVEDDADLARSMAHRVIVDVERPYAFDDYTVVIGCSIGLCRSADAADGDSLMQRADLALYEAKRNGRGRAVCYEHGMLEAVTDRNRLENELRIAVSESQFYLAYQPIQSLASDGIIGYEALIRWQHPTRGLVSPMDFIPLSEETGLIVPIGRWVLEEACREAMRWPVHQHVAVNVSAVQFRSPLLLAHVTGALSASGLPPHRLEIELTETALVEDGPQIALTLAALRALGIKIAMDDFGTGYSSLAHLRDLPLDRIKIDRSFVSIAMADPHSLAVVRAITQMGRDMGIETLAEGVETQEQLDLLRTLGCGAVQGFLIGRPERPIADLPAQTTRNAA